MNAEIAIEMTPPIVQPDEIAIVEVGVAPPVAMNPAVLLVVADQMEVVAVVGEELDKAVAGV